MGKLFCKQAFTSHI